jgi:hypothetical protein
MNAETVRYDGPINNNDTRDLMGKFFGVSRRAVLGGLVSLPAWMSRSAAAQDIPPSQAFLRPLCGRFPR